MATATAAFNETLRTLTEEQNRCRCRLTEDLAAWGCCLHSKTLLSTTPQSDERRSSKSRRMSVVRRNATKSGGPARRAVSCCHLPSSTGDACSSELQRKRGGWRRMPRRPATEGPRLAASQSKTRARQRCSTVCGRPRKLLTDGRHWVLIDGGNKRDGGGNHKADGGQRTPSGWRRPSRINSRPLQTEQADGGDRNHFTRGTPA